MAVRQRMLAARLGNDLLLQIFYHLDTDASLCVAARVCRSWTHPAQELLYNTLCLGPSDPPASRGLLARTMRSCPRLAGMVRYLSLDTDDVGSLVAQERDEEEERDDVEWLHHLPAHGLARFRYAWAAEDTFDLTILAAPAVRTVPHLVAHGPLTPASLRACIALPRLETLEVDLAHCSDDETSWGGPGQEWDWIDAGAALAPRLRKLLVRVYFVACPAPLALFGAFAPQLEAFQLHALFELFQPHRAWAAALSSPPSFGCDSNLKELVLSGGVAWPKGGEPFMDAVVRRHKELERVRCPLGSYSDAFFRDLPQSVRVLELYVDADADKEEEDGPAGWFPHARALAQLIRRQARASGGCGDGDGRRDSEGGLREVRFLSQYRTTVPVSASAGSGWRNSGDAELVDAAREGGVRLVCVRVPGLYTPVQCMAEADIVESSFGSDFCF